MSQSEAIASLREELSSVDLTKEGDKYLNRIKEDYKAHGKFQISRADQRNIMFIGRSRTGKSTIKSILVDPTIVPDDLTLKSGTRNPLFETFHIYDNQIVLNIIDTPRLFERSTEIIDIRDNEAILNTIEVCINREITKFHVICFCVAITVGINQEDIDSLKLLVQFLGEEISKNSCLIITRCESKNDAQRKKMREELESDAHFKDIVGFFQLDIFFSGSLNRDNYNNGNRSILTQYVTITDYRRIQNQVEYS